MVSEPTPAEQLRELEARLHVLEALVRMLDDPHAFVDIVLASDDTSGTVGVLRDAFGFSEVQALAALDFQFRRLDKLGQSRLRSDLAEMRAERDRLGRSV